MRAIVRHYRIALAAAVVVVTGGATLSERPADAAPTPLSGVPVASATVAATAVTPAEAVDARSARVDEALDELSRKVGRTSDSRALEAAFQAYFAFKAEHPEQVRKPFLYFVDYGLANTTPRGWVFNMETLDVVEGPFNVAHGRGAGPRNGIPTRFSNVTGSAASSLGLYVAQETYGFSCKANGRRYTSIGLRMQGVSDEFNSRARARGVVVHGAPYVNARDAGRSEGCPAMEEFRAQRLLPKLADGGMVFVFAPKSAWLNQDPWVTAD